MSEIPRQTRWVCMQLGAREHYAVPRALASVGALDALITDAWVAPGSLGMPGALFPRLAGRFHPALAATPVHAGGLAWAATDAWLRARRRLPGHDDWELFVARNRRFDRLARRKLDALLDAGGRGPPGDRALFAYSYAGTETLAAAAGRGCRAILGQIDGGPAEEQIVLEEKSRYPALEEEYRPAPAAYWREWRAQCDTAARIVVNSPWARECLEKSGIARDKLAIVPLYLDAPGRAARAARGARDFTPADPMRVLFLGQLNLRKGAGRLFDAIRRLKGEPIAFEVVGPAFVAIPPDVAALASFRYHGPATRADVHRHYGRSDVFLLPTLSDGFAITQLEAQAHGLPLVASRHCGEVVAHGVNGLLLPEVSAEAIAEALLALARDPQRLHAMAARSTSTFPDMNRYARALIEATCS